MNIPVITILAILILLLLISLVRKALPENLNLPQQLLLAWFIIALLRLLSLPV